MFSVVVEENKNAHSPWCTIAAPVCLGKSNEEEVIRVLVALLTCASRSMFKERLENFTGSEGFSVFDLGRG